jgi:hypothetical protein
MPPRTASTRSRRSLCQQAGVLLCLALAACGGGGGSSSNNGAVATYPASPASLSDSNVAAIAVESGPGSNVNIPYVSVTVCVPGTRQCTTIDHVMVDTGSVGLRLFASQVSPQLHLPPHTIGASSTISECAQFLNTLGWGSIKVADVEIGGEHAPAVPIQLMDASFAPLPTACGVSPLLSTSSNAANNTQALTANGILGVGLFAHDGQIYFNCAQPDGNCQLSRNSYPSPTQQVQNPVSLFTSGNNNGVVIHLPALVANGATSAQGYLIFGVGTQRNNQLGAAKVIALNAGGFFTTEYRGTLYNSSFLDSGSNGLYFADPAPSVLGGTCRLAQTDFYCPSSTQDLHASIQLQASSASVNFSIANADALFQTSGNFAFGNLGGPLGAAYFDWGLPFFFGRSVYTVMEGKSVNTGSGVLNGPMNAFSE